MKKSKKIRSKTKNKVIPMKKMKITHIPDNEYEFYIDGETEIAIKIYNSNTKKEAKERAIKFINKIITGITKK